MAEFIEIPENDTPSFNIELTQAEQDQITSDLIEEGCESPPDPVKAIKAVMRYIRRKWDER